MAEPRIAKAEQERIVAIVQELHRRLRGPHLRTLPDMDQLAWTLDDAVVRKELRTVIGLADELRAVIGHADELLWLAPLLDEGEPQQPVNATTRDS